MKDTPYYKIFADIYNYMKAYYPTKKDDEYWKSLLEEARNIYKKYQDTEQGEFVKALVLAVQEELDREYKR